MIAWKTLASKKKESLLTRLARWLVGGKKYTVRIVTEQVLEMPLRVGSISQKVVAMPHSSRAKRQSR